MTGDAFRRFALIVAASLYVLGLIVVWRWLGVWAAVAVFAGGVALAVFLSVEPVPSKPKLRSVQGEGEGLSRRAIVRRSEGRDA